eukprot:8579489-Prorocentrum_lima.AAC.1
MSKRINAQDKFTRAQERLTAARKEEQEAKQHLAQISSWVALKQDVLHNLAKTTVELLAQLESTATP